MPRSYSNAKALTGSGTGDVVGPVSSTDNAIARWNGTGGDTIQNSAAFVDDNGNVYAPNLANGYATTATAAGTTTLTVASKGIQVFTGATTQTVTLPVVSTLPQTGFGYWIINNSSDAVTVNSSGGNAIQVMAASSRMLVVANALSGTSAAVWDKVYVLAGSGDVTALGTLTSNAVMLGGGTTVVTAADGITSPTPGELQVGISANTVGAITFYNAHASGNAITIVPTENVDLANRTLTLPASNNDTFAVLAEAQTLTNKTIDCDSNTVTNVARLKVDADNTLPATCAKGEVVVLDNGTFWSGQATNDWQQVLTASDIGGVRAVTGTTDTILSTDFSKMVTYSNASSIAVTLPQAGSGSPAAFVSGFYFDVQNLGAGTVTITPTTSTINGAATLVLLSGQYTTIFSNGTNYVSFMPVNKVNGLTVTNSTGTLTIANGKTATVSNTLTLAGTDSTTMTFPTTTATVARTDAGQTFTGTQTFGAVVGTTWNGNTWATGTGTLSIAASKTLTASNTLTFAGTDSTTMTFPSTSATIARSDAANTFLGAQTINVDNAQPLRIVRPATGQAQISVTAGGTNEWESFVFNGLRWNGSTGTPSVLSDGMDLLNFNGAAWQSGAYDGGTYESSGAFRLEADGNHGSGSVPGKWTIRTTPSGSTTPVERFSIRATGSVVIGNSSSALSTSATDGFLYIPTCAGTPTGAPTAITGVAPIVIDTTNHKLYFRSGGSWRDAGP